MNNADVKLKSEIRVLAQGPDYRIGADCDKTKEEWTVRALTLLRTLDSYLVYPELMTEECFRAERGRHE